MKLPLSIIFVLFGLIIHSPTQGQTALKQIGLHTMSIGKIEAVVISDGHLVVKPVQAEFAPRTDFSQVVATLEDNFSSTSEVDLAMNILLLKTGNKRILIDAGAGHIFGTESGWLVRNLCHAGILPTEITDIVITHAHPDHIGGLTDQEGNLMFPNAEIYLAKKEYDFWMSPEPDFSKSTMPHTPHLKMMIDVAKRNIKAVTDKLHLFDSGTNLLDCIQIQLATGHTPGHTILRIYSEGEELYHLADVVHSEIISFTHPEWIYNSDSDFQLGIKTRQTVLKQMATSKALFLGSHLPWPGLGYATPKKKAFRWIQKRILIPY